MGGKEFPWYPKPVNDLAAGPEGINETASVILLMEGVSSNRQAELSSALEEVATRVLAEAKTKKEEAPFCFFTGKAAGGITDRVRELCNGGEVTAEPQMFLLDIPDSGGYYVSDGTVVTEKSIAAFIADYRNGAL